MTGAVDNSMDRPGGFVLTDRALVQCGFPTGARILDVGCGSGATVRRLVHDFGLVAHGIDKVPHATWDHNNFACARGEHLPFRNGAMAGVILECSLSVMDDPDLVLRECCRLLERGGHLAISDLYARGEEACLTGCLGRIDRRETISSRLANQGFEMKSFEDFSHPLLTLWGQRIFDKGLTDFCAEMGADKEKLKAMNCGYFLSVARKGGS
jgi:ubiquinone/menaquinone biosynthesis C-methylase UbiE